MINYKKLISVATCLVLAFGAFAQKQSEKRVLSSFDELRASGPLTVILIADSTEEVIIETEKAKLYDIITEVRGKTLKIKTRNEFLLENPEFTKDQGINVFVHYRVLREVTATTGAKVRSDNVMQGDKIKLTAATGSTVDVEVKVNTLDLAVTEGGRMVIYGKTKSQDSYVSTGGILESFRLYCDDTFIKLTAGGVAEVNAFNKLEASTNMGGIIRYKGNPKEISKSTTLGGRIYKVEDSR